MQAQPSTATKTVMVRALLSVFVVGVVGTAAATSDARPAMSIPVCQAVQLAGGDDNGLTGGVVVAHVFVKNVGRRACVVVGRPWIRIPRLAHPVTVQTSRQAQRRRLLLGGLFYLLGRSPAQRSCSTLVSAIGIAASSSI